MFTIIIQKKDLTLKPEFYTSNHMPLWLTVNVFWVETEQGYTYYNINDILTLEVLKNGQST